MLPVGFYERLLYAKENYNPDANCFGTALFSLGITNADGGIFCDITDFGSYIFLKENLAKMSNWPGEPDVGAVVLITEARPDGIPLHMGVVTRRTNELFLGGRRGLGLCVGYADPLKETQEYFENLYQFSTHTKFLEYRP